MDQTESNLFQNNIVTYIPNAGQRLGKHVPTTERLFSMWSAPRPLLCNDALNTLQQYRLCFLRGPCRVVIRKCSVVERSTARVFSRDSPWKVAQWTGRPIRES
jgi:hypothetical protein